MNQQRTFPSPRHFAGRVTVAAMILAGATWIGAPAVAQTYPAHPITMVVGYPPGGSNDIVARILSEPLGKALDTTIVVENKAGANGTIGANHVAKSRPDGYTLFFSSASPLVLSPQTMETAPFNPVRDFTAINMVGFTPEMIATGPTLKVKTLKELLDVAKTKPVTLSSSGIGGLPHLTIELLKKVSGSNIVHVPYKGAGPAMTDTLAGHVDGIVMDLPPLYPLIKDGRLTALAVTSKDRVSFLNSVPTAQEVLPGFDVVNWLAVFAPAGTPANVVDRLERALQQVVAEPDVRKQLENVAVVPSIMKDPAAFQQFFNHEYDRWGTVIKDAGVKM